VAYFKVLAVYVENEKNHEGIKLLDLETDTAALTPPKYDGLPRTIQRGSVSLNCDANLNTNTHGYELSHVF
jgi:hypothetical protein